MIVLTPASSSEPSGGSILCLGLKADIDVSSLALEKQAARLVFPVLVVGLVLFLGNLPLLPLGIDAQHVANKLLLATKEAAVRSRARMWSTRQNQPGNPSPRKTPFTSPLPRSELMGSAPSGHPSPPSKALHRHCPACSSGSAGRIRGLEQCGPEPCAAMYS